MTKPIKNELGSIIDKIKSDNQNIIDMLVTDYQVYDATEPRLHQNLSGFQMLKEKVASKDKTLNFLKKKQKTIAHFTIEIKSYVIKTCYTKCECIARLFYIYFSYIIFYMI